MKFLKEDLKNNTLILTISFALIISEFFFYNISWRALGSSHYLIFNTLILFLFSSLLIFLIFKIMNKYIFNFSNNSIRFTITLLFSFIYFKIIQIPFFLANKIYLKTLFEITFKNFLSPNFYFLLPYLKILSPFLIIFFILYFCLTKYSKLIINFAFSFSIIFLIYMMIDSFKRIDHMNLVNIPNINQTSERQVIWFVLDEFDPLYLSDKKINLKNIEKLLNKSVIHHNNYSPSNATLISMPSILMSTKVSGYKMEKRSLKILNNGKTIPFEIQNTIFQRLTDKNYSYKIISETIPYCTLLKINFNCMKDFTNFKYFFDGIKHTYIPSEYFKKIKESFLNNEKFDLEKLNSFDNYNVNDLFLSQKYGITLGNFDNLINENNNLIFFHLYLPHTDYNLDDPLSTKYVRDFFNFKISSNDEEYYLNLKFLDILINQIIEVVNKNNKKEILLLFTSDHWRRVDSPNKARPSLFVAKIKNDNLKVEIYKDSLNTHIPDLIIQFLDSKIKNHQDVKNFLESYPKLDLGEIHLN